MIFSSNFSHHIILHEQPVNVNQNQLNVKTDLKSLMFKIFNLDIHCNFKHDGNMQAW